MGAGKNPYLRYRIIHSCLSDPRKKFWSIQHLIDRMLEHDLTVDKRSIERDIEMMRYDQQLGYFAPIAYNRKEKGYYYTSAHFSLEKLPLNEDDLQALSLAANILHQYKSAKLVQQFEGMVDRLSKMVAHLRQPNNKLIAFEHSLYYKGREYFDALLQAITQRQALCISYLKFDATENHEHVFHPYFLKEYRDRWYALGYSEARESIITLGLDRMQRVTNANVSFKENQTLKPKEYFQHTLGITLGKGPAQDIELWFSKTIAPYIKTQHIHHSQKTIREDESGLTISLRLIPNPELTQLVLSYGADVKVVKPTFLKDEIRKIWEKAIAADKEI